MGIWFTRFLLKEGMEIIIADRNEVRLPADLQQPGVETATSEEAIRRAEVVLLSVTIDNAEKVIQEISPFIRKGQIVIDITSIKVPVVAAMHHYIKKGVTLGVHPMFGPGAIGIAGQNFVLTPVGDREQAIARKVAEFLSAREAKAVIMTPEQHDKMMSVVLGLSHFIALVTADTLSNLDSLSFMQTVGGTTYKVLLNLVESVISDDPALYSYLQMNLPGMKELEELFQRNTESWLSLVQNKDRAEFASSMNALKDRFKKAN